VYSGTYHQRLDAKGRVALPARLREALAGDGQHPLVVTAWQQAVWLYDAVEWRHVVEQGSLLPTQNRDAATFIRYFFGHATEVEPDGQGRILIPPVLRDLAGLQREVVVAGQFRHVEFWDRARWEAGMPTTQEEFDVVDAGLAGHNLLL